MLRLVTEYLLLYKRVCIPYVGTFEMVRQSVTLDVADKVFTPPAYITLYHNRESLSDHQVNFFALYNHEKKDQLTKDLQNFGLTLKNRIENEAFEWNGFGTLRSASDEIIFIPQNIIIKSLQRLKAEKVIYSNSSHQVLVGDREMTSRQIRDLLNLPVVKKRVLMTIALSVLLLAFAFLVYTLIDGDFEPGSLGL